MTDIQAFPLAWPLGWPRTPKPRRAVFAVSFASARDDLLHELRLLGARNVVLSTNVPLRRDGLPYAGTGEPGDPAVAVYFGLRGEPRCLPCDRWDRVRDNLRAVGLSVAALRGLDRWGSGQMVDAAFAGFAALPAGSGAGWWVVLGVEPTATRPEIDAAYRAKAKDVHPDNGGDAERFRIVAEAYERGKAATG